MEQCSCSEPLHWTDLSGSIKGNVCRRCKGKIGQKPDRFNELQRAILSVPEDDREDFIEYLDETLYDSIRKKYLIWNLNRVAQRV